MVIRNVCILLSIGFVSIYLLNVNQSSETIEYILEMIIEKLIQLKLNVHQQSIKSIQINHFNLEQSQYKCPDHHYTSRIIQRKPMMIYIEHFLTEYEIQHLIQLAEPYFKRSMLYDYTGELSFNEQRTSTSSYIKRHQTPIVECIERRFAQFQGIIDLKRLEQIQVVKYIHDQQVKPHHDWFGQENLLQNGGQRETTFVTYLQSNCSEGGETEFIHIKYNQTLHSKFCDILNCDSKSSQYGIRVRPIPGNSIFWFNIDEKGEVDYLTYHAGLPPKQNCQKIGLNTWTREKTLFISSEN